MTHDIEVADEVAWAANILAHAGCGALIVIEGRQGLHRFVETGVSVNADLSAKFLLAIFQKTSPLHDGAVIIREDRVLAASCHLPATEVGPHQPPGTRDRIGLEVTRTTDAIVIAVSETTASIHLWFRGRAYEAASEADLQAELCASLRNQWPTSPNLRERIHLWVRRKALRNRRLFDLERFIRLWMRHMMSGPQRNRRKTILQRIRQWLRRNSKDSPPTAVNVFVRATLNGVRERRRVRVVEVDTERVIFANGQSGEEIEVAVSSLGHAITLCVPGADVVLHFQDRHNRWYPPTRRDDDGSADLRDDDGGAPVPLRPRPLPRAPGAAQRLGARRETDSAHSAETGAQQPFTWDERGYEEAG